MSNSASIIFLFGRVTKLLSNVLILVLLNPTFSTVPLTVPTVTVSPTVNGLSKNMVKEPKRFSKLSLDAIARAIPPIPKPVISPVAFTPKTSPRIIPPTNIYDINLIISIVKGTNWSSILFSVSSALF